MKLLSVFICLAETARSVVEDDIASFYPDTQRAITIPTLPLTLPHQVILLFRELIGQQLQQVLWS